MIQTDYDLSDLKVKKKNKLQKIIKNNETAVELPSVGARARVDLRLNVYGLV